jgi:hypothetical protein
MWDRRPASGRADGAEDAHVVRLDEIVADLLDGDGRIEIVVRARRPTHSLQVNRGVRGS